MNQQHYGVVVGINRYPDIRDLNYARGDAEKFTEWLTDPQGGGVPIANVVTIAIDDGKMPDGTPRENALPTRREVFNALYKFRKAADDRIKQHPEDWEQTRLYFYVSGHGIAPEAKDAALLLADAGPDWYGENISCARVISFLTKNQPFREVVVFADCCRERVDNAPLGDLPWTVVERNNGHVISILGCATYFGDLAYEPLQAETDKPDQLRGYFTQALLEGLKGLEAADSVTGEINSNNLASYVRWRVLDLTKDRTYPQEPTMDADPAAPIIFRPPSARPVSVKHEVRLEFVTAYRGKAELWDNSKRIREYDPADGDWVEPLANGLYEVRAVDGGADVHFLNDGLFRVLGEGKHVQL